MISIRDFRKADGGVDWDAYHAAQIDSGDRCKQCGDGIMSLGLGSMLFGGKSQYVGGPRKCYDCNLLETNLEETVRHATLVRCPKCGHHEDVFDGDNYQIYGDGIHPFNCEDCDHGYTVTTHVSHEFESPIRLEYENGNASEE